MYTGNENHEISLQDAADLTQRYRDQFSSTTPYIKGEFFGKTAIQGILDETGSVGIRIYYGLDSENIPKLVIVGVDEDGNDLTEGTILEFGSLCPPNCSTANALNS